jgi:hypothetical protein
MEKRNKMLKHEDNNWLLINNNKKRRNEKMIGNRRFRLFMGKLTAS